jgi:hypothetical protein
MDSDFDAALRVCLAWSLAITLTAVHFELAEFYQQMAFDAAVNMGFDGYHNKTPMPTLFKGIAAAGAIFQQRL